MSINSITTSQAGGYQAGFVGGFLALGAPLAAAPTGSDETDAAQLEFGFTVVTGADGTKGVILPAANPGAWLAVYSATATNGLKIYPASGESINGGTADVAITIEGKTLALFAATATGNWAAMFTAN